MMIMIVLVIIMVVLVMIIVIISEMSYFLKKVAEFSQRNKRFFTPKTPFLASFLMEWDPTSGPPPGCTPSLILMVIIMRNFWFLWCFFHGHVYMKGKYEGTFK